MKILPVPFIGFPMPLGSAACATGNRKKNAVGKITLLSTRKKERFTTFQNGFRTFGKAMCTAVKPSIINAFLYISFL